MNLITKRFAYLMSSLLLAVAITGTVQADLIANGGFETGTFSSWTVVNQSGGTGNWLVLTGTAAPLSGDTVAAPPQGTHDAVSDGGGPGSHVLLQSFTVAPGSTVTLTFDMFVGNTAGIFFAPDSLDFNAIANQQARVDILTAGATPFALGASVVDNVLNASANTSGFVAESFNITSAVGGGGTFQLRFAEVDDLATFNFGIDAVSIMATTTSAVPEPGSLALLATIAIGFSCRRLRFRKPARSFS